MDVESSVHRFLDTSVKGFLGPTLKENPGLPSLGIRAARDAGVVVDSNTGKMRCPNDTPGAGRFTDIQMSNCSVPLNAAEIQGTFKSFEEEMEQKAGIFHSSTRTGRAAQAVGSIVLPGNSSAVRSPVASATTSFLRGGGKRPRVGSAIGSIDKFRCPAGFENGGRFTGRDFSGCGALVFSPADGFRLDDAVTESIPGSRRPKLGFDLSIPNAGESSSRILRGTDFTDRATQINRNVNIPRNGDVNDALRQANARRAAALVAKNRDDSYLVRRDGVTLKPEVDFDKLASLITNPDMDAGIFVTDGTTISKEIDMLLNTRLGAVLLVLPDGSTAKITKARQLTAGDKRVATERWAEAPGPEGLLGIIDNVDGGFKFVYTGNQHLFQDVQIRPAKGGATRTVPRWVYETYLSSKAVGREGRQVWELVDG